MEKFVYALLAMLNEMSPYVLLGFLIAGVLHAFVKPSVMTRHLSGDGWKPVLKAALFGIPLPLCSCGVLPTAVSLRRQGASRSATTSFLIATPQTGVDSIAATYSLLGLPFAILRPIAALAGAAFGGMAVSRLDPGEGSAAAAECDASCAADVDERPAGFLRRCAEAVKYGLVDMVAHVGKWLVIGLLIAAMITVFVPDSFFLRLNDYPLAAMLVMVAVAVPMYVCATGSIPIALSLMLKGLSPGVAFVLLMAGPAANFASVVVLSRTMGRRTTVIYVASVTLTALAFGLMIHYLMPAGWFVPGIGDMAGGSCHEEGIGWFETACSVLLVGLLVYAGIGHRHNDQCDHINHNNHTVMNTKTYKIEGMACPHCQGRVEKAIAAVEGVESVTVSLGDACARVSGPAEPSKVIEAIKMAGYEYVAG